LVQGMQRLLDNSELRARIGQKARQTILDKFTLSSQAEKLVKIYEEAIR